MYIKLKERCYSYICTYTSKWLSLKEIPKFKPDSFSSRENILVKERHLKIADYKIETVTGQEVIAGSTRMKAGTSTKMILNMISTGVFVKLGKVYNNLMVDMMPVNEKLVERSKNIISKATGVDYEKACELYAGAHNNVKVAICMYETGLNEEEATKLLDEYDGYLKKAINAYKNK